MKTVDIHYGVTFGKCDSSDWIEWEVDLTDEEALIYDAALEKGLSLNDIPELKEALHRAYREIEEVEIENGLEMEDELVMECQGYLEMDPDELNDLVSDRDPHALEFFGLVDADEEEIENWDANDLDELPLIKDFVEDFEPESPYDVAWILNVVFVDPNN